MGQGERIDGHVVHPIMLALPTALWMTSLGADLAYRAGFASARWDDVAFFALFGGLVAALLAVVPVGIDNLAGAPGHARDPRLRLTLVVVGLNVVSLCLRAYRPELRLSVGLSVVAVALLATAFGEHGAPATLRAAPRSDDIRIVTRHHPTAQRA